MDLGFLRHPSQEMLDSSWLVFTALCSSLCSDTDQFLKCLRPAGILSNVHNLLPGLVRGAVIVLAPNCFSRPSKTFKPHSTFTKNCQKVTKCKELLGEDSSDSSLSSLTLLPFLAKNSSNVTSQNNVYASDICGRHFLFDKRWKNGTCITIGIEDDVLINHNPTNPLSQEFHVYRSHNLTRFAHRKELCPRDPRPLICGSDYLASFPSVLLPATTPSVSGQLCLSQNYKNRLRMKNRARYLFSDGANNKTQSYPDPHLGASASFVQRLTEISSLEAETVRQERMKRLKKINRQDS
ncbi:uncharacterized protein LOC107657797 [Sinocyclocheilus anshuiensis]|uniref:uncharacterized protein LOC107657797 n=1 Tax=Sinocyclocheilus anshuiensis TaxID=1608454 RepID=UPI0007BA2301|nr:PREDICTED: uncharacterized protein LOC107657797 [Sinocyclocheilus anshuiensis]